MTITACQQADEITVQEIVDPPLIEAEIIEAKIKAEVEETEQETTITIGSVGDVLLHSRVYKKAQTPKGYDFIPQLEAVESLLQAPDFMMANQESMPGGIELGLSTYPQFNSPHEIVSDLQSLGVDMLIGANNHTLDRGVAAVESALDFYDEIGMEYVGVYRDTEDRLRDRIMTVDGIDLGVLAYTYGTNGIPIPSGYENIVALIDPNRIENDVKHLRDKVDVLIVHMHWGAEYENEPNDEQRHLAEQLSEWGVDVIFGHHPHVLQPIEVITQESGYETTVFYSLGNFISSQDFGLTDIGGVATLDITKRTKGDAVTIEVSNPHIEPTIVQQTTWKVYPFAEAEFTSVVGRSYQETVEHTQMYLTN